MNLSSLIKHLILSSFLFTLCQCSTLTEEQCQTAQWENIGLVDGQKGRSSDYLNHHKQSCRANRVDDEAYEKARLFGLLEFCTFAGGYEYGQNNDHYNNSCQNLNDEEFKKGFLQGRDIRLLRAQKQEVTSKIEAKNEQIHNDKSVLNHATQTYNFISGRSPTAQLDKEENEVNKKIYNIESSLPAEVSTNSFSYSNATDIMVNSFGALTGTVLGFGIGHAIQGRYLKTGWKWTLADVATFTAVGKADDYFCNNSPSNNGECQLSITSFSIIAIISLRIWQSVNLWRNIKTSEYDPQYQIGLNRHGLFLTGHF